MTREDFDHEARILLKPESGNGSLMCGILYWISFVIKLFLLLWLILIQQHDQEVLLIFQLCCMFFVAHLHNQFLLAILTKCQSLGSSVCKYIFCIISLKLKCCAVIPKCWLTKVLFTAVVRSYKACRELTLLVHVMNFVCAISDWWLRRCYPQFSTGAFSATEKA